MAELMEPPDDVVLRAMAEAGKSRCRSQRGAVIFRPPERGLASDIIGAGCNHQPYPFVCDGSETCKANCGRTAVHAEEAAIMETYPIALPNTEILHVKVSVGRVVPVSDRRCVRCSGMALERGIGRFWLYHEDGWRRYEMVEFHNASLAANGWPVAKR